MDPKRRRDVARPMLRRHVRRAKRCDKTAAPLRRRAWPGEPRGDAAGEVGPPVPDHGRHPPWTSATPPRVRPLGFRHRVDALLWRIE